MCSDDNTDVLNTKKSLLKESRETSKDLWRKAEQAETSYFVF